MNLCPTDESPLRQVAKKFGLAFIALFGSAAKGRATKRSDWENG